MSPALKATALSALLMVSSLPARADMSVDFSDLFSRGNLFSDANNSVSLVIGPGVDVMLSRIDFTAFAQANPLLTLGTTIHDLSVEVRYQDAGSDLSVNLGFDVGNIGLLPLPSDVPDHESLSGTLEQFQDTPYTFTGWRLKTGGTLTFAFNEVVDDASFDALENGDYWDAKWLTGSAMNLVTAPVPEPETYAMMLAGLGLLGLMARRRPAV